MEDLEKVYEVTSEEVREFLASRPELVDLLLEARRHFERQFGADVVVRLRFPIRFPEDEEQDLFASIQSSFDVDTTHEKVNKFWDEWFGDASGRPEAHSLIISTDFIGDSA